MIANLLALCALLATGLKKDEPSSSSSLSYDPEDVPTEKSLKEFSGDWLFHVRTTSCNGTTFDLGNSYISRSILPILCLGALTLVLCTRESTESEKSRESSLNDGDQAERGGSESPNGRGKATGQSAGPSRLFHVDFARICAVMCVIFEHSGGMSYTHRNVGFGLWWALPYLYVTSGMASMMTKSSMCAYIFRLLIVFAVGVSANLLADVVNHRDWKHDFGNTIFQMFFVIMLLIMAPLGEPLRHALRKRQELEGEGQEGREGGGAGGEKDGRAMAFTMFWGIVTAGALATFVRGFTGDADLVPFQDENVSRWIHFYAPVLRHTPIILVHVGGTLFLTLLATLVCHPNNTGMVGWILLAFSYLQMILIPWDQDSFAHLMNLNIVGMVTYQWPLAGSKRIAALVQAYWPFLLMLLCLDSMPDMWGRCDVHSPYSTWERFRMFFGEFTLVVCFVAGAFTPSDPKKITGWLNIWSLYAYCFHVMWYRLLGSPYGAIVTFAGIPLFWLAS